MVPGFSPLWPFSGPGQASPRACSPWPEIVTRRPYNAVVRLRINRYIISEIIGPMGLGFLVYTFILLLRFLFQSAEMIIRRGLPVSIVGQMLLVTLPNIVVLTLPMSLLFGILIAVGRLSSDSELTAMRSSGISLVSLYRPVLLVSAALTILNTLLMIYILPWEITRCRSCASRS